MSLHARGLVAGAAALALGMWFLVVGSRSAADEKAGDVKEAVQKIADAWEKGDSAEAKKLAQEVAKDNELEDVMSLMAKSTGKKKVFSYPDQSKGIEAKLIALPKQAKPPVVEKQSADLVKMAYRVKAISEVAKNKTPEKDEGEKKVSDWKKWADEMQKGAQALADAAKAKDAAAVKKTAVSLRNTCNSCHEVFRD